MIVQEKDVKTFAQQIGLNQEELIRQSLLAFIWSRLQVVKMQILELQKKYNIETVYDFDKLYETGEVEEADSWRDVQKFDRLTFEQEMYENFLKLWV